MIKPWPCDDRTAEAINRMKPGEKFVVEDYPFAGSNHFTVLDRVDFPKVSPTTEAAAAKLADD